MFHKSYTNFVIFFHLKKDIIELFKFFSIESVLIRESFEVEAHNK